MKKKGMLYSALLHLFILSFLVVNIAFFKSPNYVTQSVMHATLLEVPKPTVKEINKNKEIAPPKEVIQEKSVPAVISKPTLPEKTLEKPTPHQKPIPEKVINIEDKKNKPEKIKPVEKKELREEKKPVKKSQKTQKSMEEKLWAQQLAEEDKQLTTLKEQQAQGVVNKYNALILQAIRDQWILPETYPPEMYCQLLVNLKSDGAVIDVQLTKTSGNEGFDRSARAAVYKASPLPVPKETDLFNQMKVINLTVRP